MEERREYFPITKTEIDSSKIIIKNVITMLGNRIYINADGEKKPLLSANKVLKQMEDQGDYTYTFKVDNGDNYVIKIFFYAITSIIKQPAMNDFLKDYTLYKKIIVAEDYTSKISDYANANQAQIFTVSSMQEDLISHKYQPRYELLTPTEMLLVKKEYNITDYTTKKILKNDPVTRYFGLKKGDIIRIIRGSPVSGETIDYRIVV